jgi:hypothetical protein
MQFANEPKSDRGVRRGRSYATNTTYIHAITKPCSTLPTPNIRDARSLQFPCVTLLKSVNSLFNLRALFLQLL